MMFATNQIYSNLNFVKLAEFRDHLGPLTAQFVIIVLSSLIITALGLGSVLESEITSII